MQTPASTTATHWGAAKEARSAILGRAPDDALLRPVSAGPVGLRWFSTTFTVTLRSLDDPKEKPMVTATDKNAKKHRNGVDPSSNNEYQVAENKG
jgi:hypothetical protein